MNQERLRLKPKTSHHQTKSTIKGRDYSTASTHLLQSTVQHTISSLSLFESAIWLLIEARTMDSRVVLLLLFIMLSTTSTSYSRTISPLRRNAMRTHYQKNHREALVLGGAFKDRYICTICEEFTSKALYYLSSNSTQTEIMELLYHSCSRVPTFEHQCISLVDNYAPLFFIEVTSIEPEDFCQRVNLCRLIALVDTRVKQERCELCHHAVSEVLDKLKDPDTQLDIIEMLLKLCDSVEMKNARKCKKMVLEYGPLVLDNAEQFLESRDVCAAIHACNNVPPLITEA